jgi:hypothetical protein
LEQTILILTNENRRLKTILSDQDTLFADLKITPPIVYHDLNSDNSSVSISSSSADSSSSDSSVFHSYPSKNLNLKTNHNDLCALCQCEIHFDPQFLGDINIVDYDSDYCF